MTCSNIYLGTGRFGAGPLAAEYWNDAIVMTSYTPTVNVGTFVLVNVNNHGTDDSPSSLLELFWSDPTTGFQALSARLIGSVSPIFVGGATTLGPEGLYMNNFSWTPDNTALGTNGGHVCLLARVSNNSAPASPCTQQTFNSSSPATDPQSAIHNVQIITPPPPPPGPGGPGGGGGGGGGKKMAFAFAATNTLPDLEDTKLHVRVLDPANDRNKLERLVANRSVDRVLARRGVRFTLPKDVHLVEGRERVIVDPRSHQVRAGCVPRIGRLGPLDHAAVERLTLPGTRPMPIKGPADLKLLHGESRQMVVSVEPSGKDNAAYGIEVEHLGADGRNIGGLVFVFVPPHKYF